MKNAGLKSQLSPRTVGLSMATITALSWAVLAIALKFALHSFSSGTIVWLRLILAFLILFVAFAWKKREWLQILRHPPWLGTLSAVLIAINYFGFMKGVELTTASNSQILIQLAPLSFAAMSIFLFHEFPTRQQVIGLLTAVAGFGFFYWDQILVSWEDIPRFQTGNLWLLMAAASWAIFALLQKRLLKIYKPQQYNLLVYGVAALVLTPTADFTELTSVSLGHFALIVFLAINTVVAYGALSEALTRIPASQVSVIIAVNPLLTLLIMTYLTRTGVGWIQAEPIGWRGMVGAVFVVIGVILTVTSPPRLSDPVLSPKLNK